MLKAYKEWKNETIKMLNICSSEEPCSVPAVYIEYLDS